MKEFKDTNGNNVQFLEEPETFSVLAEHVLVICKYENKWLLTNHKKRGWEFPGGKVEKEESLEAAARREVLEETGASLKKLIPIGTYKVLQPNGFFIKKVYFGSVERILRASSYLETNGPVLVDNTNILTARFEKPYSFIMQDEVIEICLEIIKNKDALQSNTSSTDL